MPRLQQVQTSRYAKDTFPGFRTVDITSLPVEQSLSSLAALHNGTELIVRISAPVHVRMVPIISPHLHKEAKAKGRGWQPLAVGELAATVALYRYAAVIDLPGKTSRRIVGPMKVTP